MGVPFPRLHFFLISQAPLLSKKASAMTGVNVRELTTQAYSARNFFSNVRPEDGKYMAASLTFRGGMSTQEVDEQLEKLNSKNQDDSSWFLLFNFSNCSSTSWVLIPPRKVKEAAMYLPSSGRTLEKKFLAE